MGPLLPLNTYDQPHLTMTYTALLNLLLLNDNLSKVRAKEIISSLKTLQQPNGSFSPFVGSHENDMRFIYCACCISFILNDFSGIDIKKSIEYIKKSQNYDGGFGTAPNHESHGRWV